MEKMNSKEYWNNRFTTDWQDFSGNEQTEYFATILGEMLPEWLIHEVNQNAYAICDLGCAEGDALPIYKKYFVTSEIYGEDFSEKAIKTASTSYPDFRFKVSDILLPEQEKKYPVVICSNVVEHFRDTYTVISKICERMDKYALILIPYREEPGKISEHERVFHTNDIPMLVPGGYLVFAKSVDCKSQYYPYEQLLLIYAKEKQFSVLADIVDHVNSDSEREKDEFIQSITEKYNKAEDNLRDKEEIIKSITEKYGLLENEKGEIEKRLNSLNEYLEQKIAEQDSLLANNALLEQKLEAEKRDRSKIDTEFNLLSQKFAISQRNLMMAMSVLDQKNEYMIQTQELCQHFATGKLMQSNHLLYRIKGQLLKGNKEDKKDFWKWFKGRRKGTNRTIGAGAIYNPWMVACGKLQEGVNCAPSIISEITSFDNQADGQMVDSQQNSVQTNSLVDLPKETKLILQQDYTKYDVIILSVIDYNFRHQRPQHFATRFAANGHRVFYVNANFIRPDSIHIQQENLYVVDFACKEHNAIYSMNGTDTLAWMKEKLDHLIFTQAIRDAVVVVDYPNWVYGAEFIREKYGFKLITDYMDDYTGFLGTAEDFLKNNCIRLLQKSDVVVASSQFLYDVASKHTEDNKITIVRNGTEVDHFYQAIGMESANKERKVIGYYGAVAHWFAYEKVCYLAEMFTECDIVIVGEVTEHKEKLERYENVLLMGEKSYKELPKYLADFDVCLIPFDTSTDLIKATNPVKFYEYLSAGKKIVATEIPELMPFRNEYVYMSNDNEQFAEYVKMCLDGTDDLKSKEECIEFARENDWQNRYEHFEYACKERIPSISIIVLTYNNLEYNRLCIDSILKKTAYPNYELIIVDNQSTDGTIVYLSELEQKKIPNVKIIFNDKNSGFAGGNNIGIQNAKGNYVLLLNNDTVVTRGWLTAMTKHLENNSKYGMCNPVTNSIGNESKICANYHNIQEMHEFAYAVTAEKMAKEYTDVDRLPLFATLIRKEVIEQVGMLDETYKIGMFEDDDYTESVKRGDYQIVIVEDAFIHHINNASFKKLDDAEYRRIFDANKKVFEKKWGKKWKMPKYREGVTADCNIHVSI